MKHPIDTSQWGRFVVGELFDNITRGTRLKKSDRKSGPTPLVTAGSENQGIAEHILENKELFDGINLTIDMFGNVFARNYPFYADDNILVLKTNIRTFNQVQFMASSLAHLANEYGYTNQFRQNTLNNTTIKLPLKPSADPSNYDSTDIDWDYMETVMSRVTARAKDRLANLPQPTDKKKTPVDTSAWGDFVVGELFDMIQGRRLKKADFVKGEIPYVMASSYNNGIINHISNPITTGEDLLTADIFGNVFYQPSFIGFGDDNCGLKLKNHNATKYQYLFLATVFKQFQNEASFTNKLRGSWYVKQSIKLPLKPSANPSDYTQDDIDWDYMEDFMKTIEEKAHERLKTLQKAIA